MAAVAIVAGAELAPEIAAALAEAAGPILAEAEAEAVPLVADAVSHLGQSVDSVYFSVKDGVIDLGRSVATQTAKSVLGAGRAVVHLTDEAGNIIHVATSQGGNFAANAWAAAGGTVGAAAVTGIIHLVRLNVNRCVGCILMFLPSSKSCSKQEKGARIELHD